MPNPIPNGENVSVFIVSFTVPSLPTDISVVGPSDRLDIRIPLIPVIARRGLLVGKYVIAIARPSREKRIRKMEKQANIIDHLIFFFPKMATEAPTSMLHPNAKRPALAKQ